MLTIRIMLGTISKSGDGGCRLIDRRSRLATNVSSTLAFASGAARRFPTLPDPKETPPNAPRRGKACDCNEQAPPGSRLRKLPSRDTNPVAFRRFSSFPVASQNRQRIPTPSFSITCIPNPTPPPPLNTFFRRRSPLRAATRHIAPQNPHFSPRAQNEPRTCPTRNHLTRAKRRHPRYPSPNLLTTDN